jgi:hypothetical protein
MATQQYPYTVQATRQPKPSGVHYRDLGTYTPQYSYSALPLLEGWQVKRAGYSKYRHHGVEYTPHQYLQRLNQTVGGYQSAIQRLQGEYRDAYGSAKEANEQRYGEILAGYDGMLQSGVDTIDKFGRSAATSVRDQYRGAKASTTAQLARTGMAGSTITGQLNKNLAREQGKDLSAIKENVAGQKLNYQTAITQGKLGVMERREDDYPNEQLYQQQIASIYESAVKSGIPVENLLQYMTLGM